MGDAMNERLTNAIPLPTDPWLMNAETVASIIDEFLSDAIAIYYSEQDRSSFLRWVKKETKRLNGLFLGHKPGENSPMHRGPWNTPDQLGAYLLKNYQVSGPPSVVVQLVLVRFLDEATTITDESLSSGTDEWEDELSDLVEELVFALLGALDVEEV